jgi:hypothetical protein
MGLAATSAIHNRASIDRYHIARCALVVQLIAVASIIASPFWLEALLITSSSDYSYTSSLVCLPLLVIVGAVVILHFTQTDAYLRRLMATGLVARMAASGVFLWMAFVIYGGVADALHYRAAGLQLADQFHFYGWSVFQPPYLSTNLIVNICGIATLLIGDNLPILFVSFSFIPLAGSYLFYRAFTIVFPDGDRWLFGLLAVLWPSILFWSSFVGKDSLIHLFIAMVCFGFAKIVRSHSFKGVLVAASGLAGVLLIRAHVAAILAIAMTLPYIAGRSRGGNPHKALKGVLVPVFLGATYFLVAQAQSFLLSSTRARTSESMNVFQEANSVAQESQYGGSAFNKGTSFGARVAESPFLLFRPFPWEINNLLSFASAVESVGLIAVCAARRREIWKTLQRWQDPYVGFLLMYTIVFCVTFGATESNFGLLARQRIMMTPLAFMVICAHPKLVTPRRSKRLKEAAHGPRHGLTTFHAA